jgi:hypothetical protein
MGATDEKRPKDFTDGLHQRRPSVQPVESAEISGRHFLLGNWAFDRGAPAFVVLSPSGSGLPATLAPGETAITGVRVGRIAPAHAMRTKRPGSQQWALPHLPNFLAAAAV